MDVADLNVAFPLDHAARESPERLATAIIARLKDWASTENVNQLRFAIDFCDKLSPVGIALMGSRPDLSDARMSYRCHSAPYGLAMQLRRMAVKNGWADDTPLRRHHPKLDEAYGRYWSSKTPRDQQAAYHEILLFGGADGYPWTNPWCHSVARLLRRAALWIEGRDG